MITKIIDKWNNKNFYVHLEDWSILDWCVDDTTIDYTEWLYNDKTSYNWLSMVVKIRENGKRVHKWYNVTDETILYKYNPINYADNN